MSPKWWQLFAVFLLGVILLAIQHALSMSAGGHEFAQILIVVVMFGLMFGWINKNAAALLDVESGSGRLAEREPSPPETDPLADRDERSTIVVYPQGLTTNDSLFARIELGSIDTPAKDFPVRG
jgi:hypothetical protein